MSHQADNYLGNGKMIFQQIEDISANIKVTFTIFAKHLKNMLVAWRSLIKPLKCCKKAV